MRYKRFDIERISDGYEAFPADPETEALLETWDLTSFVSVIGPSWMKPTRKEVQEALKRLKERIDEFWNCEGGYRER